MICHSVYSKLSANLLNSTSETRVVGVHLGSVTRTKKNAIYRRPSRATTSNGERGKISDIIVFNQLLVFQQIIFCQQRGVARPIS